MFKGRRIISLCISRLNDVENGRFVAAVNKFANENNASLLIYGINADFYWKDEKNEAEVAVFNLIDYNITDVIILMCEKIKSRRITDMIVQRAKTNKIPVVVVDDNYPDCINICCDYQNGFEAVVRHVIEHHKVKRPHFMGGIPNNRFSDERQRVFEKVLAEKGIPFNESMVSYGYFWSKTALEAAEKIYESGNIPDAIICANDVMAVNVCSYFEEKGFRVPEDIIVTGFDGIDEINYSFPKITSSFCGTSCFSESVGNALHNIFENNLTCGDYLVEPKLVISESCGCKLAQKFVAVDSIRSFNDRFYRYYDDDRRLLEICGKMYASESLREAAACLNDTVINSMTCVIKKELTNETADPFAGDGSMEFDDDMFLFFESGKSETVQRDFKRSEIIPNFEKVLEQGYPLIFNVISFMKKTIGYLCFYFKSFETVDYCRIPQTEWSISMSLGGFLNVRYQRYLNRRIEEIYSIDSLTGIYNRLSFNKVFCERLKKLKDKVVPLTVMLADLDGLKAINDTYGHSAGDNAIKVLAHALKSSCPEDALCVRFGGDEMLAVVFGECDSENIRNRIRKALCDYNDVSEEKYKVSASIGLFITDTGSNTDFEYLVRKTDKDMYEEKQMKHLRSV